MSPISWDTKFMTMAYLAAMKSKDNSTQVGAVIVGPDYKEVRTTGYNNPPRGINDDITERIEKPGRDDWFEHAERNAIYNCARMGLSTDQCILYVVMFPCTPCARAITQSGIKEVVVHEQFKNSKNMDLWDETNIRAYTILKEANVKIRWYSGPIAQIGGLRSGMKLDFSKEKPESKDSLRKEQLK